MQKYEQFSPLRTNYATFNVFYVFFLLFKHKSTLYIRGNGNKKIRTDERGYIRLCGIEIDTEHGNLRKTPSIMSALYQMADKFFPITRKHVNHRNFHHSVCSWLLTD